MIDPNEDKLIDCIINGDKAAYSQLVEKYKDYAFTLALNILHSREDAEEAAQDSFIKAYNNLKKFNRQSKFSTWLYRIVINTAITYKRKVKVVKEDLEIIKYSYGNLPANKAEIEDQKRFINVAMKQLNDEDRSVIKLFYLKEFSLDEIAEITSTKVNTIKVRLHRARKKLAGELKLILKDEAVNL